MTEEPPAYPDNFAIKARFDDFDAFTAAAFQWNLQFNQLDRGAFAAELTHVGCGPVLLGECRLERKMHQQGDSPPGCWTFGVPVNSGMQYRWRGQEIKDRQVVGFDSGTAMDSVSEEDFHIYPVSIRFDHMAALCADEELPELDSLIGRAGSIECSPDQIDRLRKVLAGLICEVNENPGRVRQADFQEKVASQFPRVLLDAFAETARSSKSSVPDARVRSRALKMAIEVIHDRAHEPVSMDELYESCSASGRTLRYAFEEAFGMSPKAYLQAHRLNQVRRDLSGLRPAEEIRISDVANAWGFWHMGQFAADYRRMFGELPSDTLQRS